MTLNDSWQGYVVYSIKQKLKQEYIGLPGNEIKNLKLSGVEVCLDGCLHKLLTDTMWLEICFLYILGDLYIAIFYRLFINKLHFFMQLCYHLLTAILFLSPVNLIWRELEVGCEKIAMTMSKSSRQYPKIYHFRLLSFQILKIVYSIRSWKICCTVLNIGFSFLLSCVISLYAKNIFFVEICLEYGK